MGLTRRETLHAGLAETGGQEDTQGAGLIWGNPKEAPGMLRKMAGGKGVLLESFKPVLAHSLLGLHG